jgi:hypothetical protein
MSGHNDRVWYTMDFQISKTSMYYAFCTYAHFVCTRSFIILIRSYRVLRGPRSLKSVPSGLGTLAAPHRCRYLSLPPHPPPPNQRRSTIRSRYRALWASAMRGIGMGRLEHVSDAHARAQGGGDNNI